MFYLSINPHTNQADATSTASLLRVRSSLNTGWKAGYTVSLAARYVR